MNSLELLDSIIYTFYKNNNDKKLSILCFGDSLTNGYANMLNKYIKSHLKLITKYNYNFTINAVDGQWVALIFDSIKSWCISQL